jgi:hypothetical protein
VQALEDSIASLEIVVVHKALSAQLGVGGSRSRFRRQLDAPEPSQHVGGEHGDSGPGRHAS